jgi:ABC-2 type transport system permease protein
MSRQDATARDRGVLKRVRGTPLSPVLYLAGRAVAAVLITILTGALVLGVGVAWLGLDVAWSGIPLAVVVLVLGTVSLAACGYLLASALRSSRTVTAVGLGIALPLSFFSDVFAVNQTPSWIDTVGAFLPLKHLTNSVAAALDPAGSTVSWLSLVVMTAWLVGAGYLATRTFHWRPRNG